MPNKKSSPQEGASACLQLLREGHNRGSHIYTNQTPDAAAYLSGVLEEGAEQ